MIKTPIINSGDPHAKREEIRQYFHQTYDEYESLFTCLKNDEVYYARPESLRHPLIFYFGHTATFFINKLRVAKIINNRVDKQIESTFAIGVDEMSWDDLNEDNYDWPSVAAVYAYRNKVRKIVDELISKLPLEIPIKWEDPVWIILMGIEHERIHLETSSVLIRQLPIDLVQKQTQWQICQNQAGIAPDNSLINVSAGLVKQGRSQPSDTYGWDNEYGRLETEVEQFKASQFLVSNQEFLAFIEDGGYQDKTWWTEEGWQWLQFKKVSQPIFWEKQADDDYQYRTMCEIIPMPWDWPVDVNYLEAKAFCNWMSARTSKSIRLPSEAEWYRLCDLTFKQHYPNWEQAPANINLEHWASSCPVNLFKFGQFGDVIGNVWQWTETAIDSFEGFEVHPAYDDFSVPTFDGRHNLIKGGSWISTGNEALCNSRYAFRRHFYQHAGFRYIESKLQISQDFNTYETDELISQYLEFHYGNEYFGVPNYPKTCIDMIFQLLDNNPCRRALDIGCAVGRSSFELARQFDFVDAVDFSTRFIRNAINLCEHGEVKYLITDEGELSTVKSFKLADLQLGDKINNIEFTQGDACNLKDKYNNYDLVFAGNLIDRLYEPKKFLADITKRINVGGLLVIASPYTWLEEYTQKEHWLGGFKENGENLTTYDGLERFLSANFEAVGEPHNVPFVIRETARKFQHTVAQLSVWRRRV
jgi:5-histidylcysteine sulfoxide synthase/putative 4-mercaptohistidine N1-methyltranferase